MHISNCERLQPAFHQKLVPVFIIQGHVKVCHNPGGRPDTWIRGVAKDSGTSACQGWRVEIWMPPYHPQANPTERRNQEIKKCLPISVGNDHRQWDKLIPTILFALCCHSKEAVDTSPSTLQLPRNGWASRTVTSGAVPQQTGMASSVSYHVVPLSPFETKLNDSSCIQLPLAHKMTSQLPQALPTRQLRPAPIRVNARCRGSGRSQRKNVDQQHDYMRKSGSDLAENLTPSAELHHPARLDNDKGQYFKGTAHRVYIALDQHRRLKGADRHDTIDKWRVVVCLPLPKHALPRPVFEMTETHKAMCTRADIDRSAATATCALVHIIQALVERFCGATAALHLAHATSKLDFARHLTVRLLCSQLLIHYYTASPHHSSPATQPLPTPLVSMFNLELNRHGTTSSESCDTGSTQLCLNLGRTDGAFPVREEVPIASRKTIRLTGKIFLTTDLAASHTSFELDDEQ
ncbi:hypothetical protein PR048_012457 [Dryococelus australis]|uniref:Uncharacterized protein n=1 Tax=Dryococelus australis TaxID=614101 RepID=A0ABQ9HPF9_9NEOP|nr:hypothetical protein PR048_012457 [Dryococelus australis]